MPLRTAPLVLLFVGLGLSAPAGCGGDKKGGDAEAQPAAEIAEEAKDEVEAAKSNDDEDKGTAVLKLGDADTEWRAKRASARLKDDGSTLRISASVYSQDDENASRRSLSLRIKDYKGPGSYVINDMSSNLTAVKLNIAKVKEVDAAKDEAAADAAAKEAALDGIKGASVVLLRDAKVEITKASDDFIDGTITWTGVALNGPNKLSGEFHARVKD